MHEHLLTLVYQAQMYLLTVYYNVSSGIIGFTASGTQIATFDANGINLVDNKKLKAGASGDLELFHDGTDSKITNTTGNLVISDSGGDIYIQAKTGENSIICADDGAVKIYYDNGLRCECAIHDGDVTFTGDAASAVWDKSDNALEFADNAKLVIGTGGDLELSHNGSTSFIKDSGTGALQIWASQLDILKSDGTETLAVFASDGACTLYHDNSAKLATSSAGVTITGALSVDSLDTTDAQGNTRLGATAGDSFDVTFPDPGDYNFQCDPHAGAGMKGVIHVS